MPRSAKAPPLPPEPDWNEIIQNDVARIKRLLGLDVNRLAIGSDIEGITPSGPFGTIDFTVTGVNTIEFVNVSTSLGPSQGGSPPPPQVTGLSATVISNTQINLAWTAYGGSDLNFYTVYRGTSPGFSADSSSDIAFPTTNSYNNTGLTAGTAYYYRVATTNDANLEGPLSVEVSGTTTGGGDVTPPGQVTGLAASVISSTQINLTWTASAAGDLNHYDVHSSTTTGFTPAVGNRISQPTTNSYNNTGLTASTTYYYKVAAVDNASNIGTYSTQASGTTQATGTSPKSVWLELNNDYTDSTGLNTTFNRIAAGNTAFATTGVFGSHYAQLNIPSIPNTTTPDHIGALDNVNCQLDFTNGFSYSLWVKPSDISSTGHDRVILMKEEAGSGRQSQIWIGIDPSGRLFADVYRFSTTTDYHKRDTVAISTAAFTHVVVTFDPSTNTLLLYKNKVLQNTAGALTITNQSGQYLNLTLGHEINNANLSAYEGAIDELQYYKVVLTQTQVNNLFSTNTP